MKTVNCDLTPNVGYFELCTILTKDTRSDSASERVWINLYFSLLDMQFKYGIAYVRLGYAYLRVRLNPKSSKKKL